MNGILWLPKLRLHMLAQTCSVWEAHWYACLSFFLLLLLLPLLPPFLAKEKYLHVITIFDLSCKTEY